jgi:hypothetical protein
VIAPEPTFSEVPVIAPKDPDPVVCMVPDPESTLVHVAAPVEREALVIAPEASRVVHVVACKEEILVTVKFCSVEVPLIQLCPAVTFSEPNKPAPVVCTVPDPAFREVPVIAPKDPDPVVWIVPEPAFREVPVIAPNEPLPVV